MSQSGKSSLFLRRVMRQLRNQDWFTVAVEVAAVVLAVFLGIQASNWNDEWQARSDEQRILERLHDETASLLSDVRDERDLLRSRSNQLTRALEVIFSFDPVRPLTNDECSALVGSHVFKMASDELPILDELIATGRFDRLRDEALRNQLRSYIQFRDRERANHVERTNELFRLHSHHPEAIQLVLVPENEEHQPDWEYLRGEDSRWGVRCDIENMRQNQLFRNELFDNSGRNGNVLDVYDLREQRLLELNEHLGALLEQ